MNIAMFILALPLAVAVVALPARTANAQSHDQAMHGGAAGGPTEPGQGAFATIQEIVAILEADPATDWEKVDLPALRQHLADMSALVLSAKVTEREIPGGFEATVSGAGRGGAAARRMVPAHAVELAKIEGWAVSVKAPAGGNVILRVTSFDPRLQPHIRGLGFFGMMVTGAHHQPHHLAIARGEPMAH
jgi:hypothetical protein